ncbi:MAG: spherulation-specific family 4 protein [Planctomycetota bacterium]
MLQILTHIWQSSAGYWFSSLLLAFGGLLIPQASLLGQEKRDGIDQLRLVENQLFFARSNQKPGLLIPLYIYPTDVFENASYNQVMQLKRQHTGLPFWVILNPASGPGKQIDANYTKAIDRLIGSGCQVLGYVPTGYGKTNSRDVANDIEKWRQFYPRVQGIFFDEMVYEDSAEGVQHQQNLKRFARQHGYWPVVGNPGADTPGRYFAGEVADVIVIHESADWPTENKLHGNYFGGRADYPSFNRAVLVHSQSNLDLEALKTIKKYSKWLYVTQDTYLPNNSHQQNPWDQLSEHLQDLCEALEK